MDNDILSIIKPRQIGLSALYKLLSAYYTNVENKNVSIITNRKRDFDRTYLDYFEHNFINNKYNFSNGSVLHIGNKPDKQDKYDIYLVDEYDFMNSDVRESISNLNIDKIIIAGTTPSQYEYVRGYDPIMINEDSIKVILMDEKIKDILR